MPRNALEITQVSARSLTGDCLRGRDVGGGSPWLSALSEVRRGNATQYSIYHGDTGAFRCSSTYLQDEHPGSLASTRICTKQQRRLFIVEGIIHSWRKGVTRPPPIKTLLSKSFAA